MGKATVVLGGWFTGYEERVLDLRSLLRVLDLASNLGVVQDEISVRI